MAIHIQQQALEELCHQVAHKGPIVDAIEGPSEARPGDRLDHLRGQVHGQQTPRTCRLEGGGVCVRAPSRNQQPVAQHLQAIRRLQIRATQPRAKTPSVQPEDAVPEEVSRIHPTLPVDGHVVEHYAFAFVALLYGTGGDVYDLQHAYIRHVEVVAMDSDAHRGIEACDPPLRYDLDLPALLAPRHLGDVAVVLATRRPIGVREEEDLVHSVVGHGLRAAEAREIP
mmetsp:Transcript_61039/g.175852  ORF Transcript_61039/g.175852 Transcript_61039/m.175852 type:complete len:226 (+) Transcript_61039:378-1055(+)